MNICRLFVGRIKKHKAISALILTIFIALAAVVILCFVIPDNNKSSKPKTLVSTLSAKKTPANIATESARLDASPASGALQYEALDTYYSPGSQTPKFIYATSEYRDERLIELNDQIISELKSSKKIDDETISYSINYFNDKDLAKIYFSKVADKMTSSSDKQILKNSYVASYIYSQQLGMNRLTKMRSLTVIKQY